MHRRDRLDEAIAAMAADIEFTPVVARLGCLRGVSTLTAFGLAVEIGDWHRLTGRSIGAYLGLVPASTPRGPPGSRAGSPRPATATPAGCWSRRPGITAAPYRPRRDLRRRWDAATAAARARGQAANQRLHTRWAGFDAAQETPRGRQRRDRPRAGRLVLVAGSPRPTEHAPQMSG